MIESKPYGYLEGYELKGSTEESMGQASEPKMYRGKKKPSKTQCQEPEADTNFKGQCSDLGGYIFDLGPRVSDKFTRTIKELEQYLGATYRESCQIVITTETPTTLPDLEMPTIVTDTGAERTKTDAEITYLENKNIDEAVRQKLRNKDVYETEIHRIYNLTVGQTNKQL